MKKFLSLLLMLTFLAFGGCAKSEPAAMVVNDVEIPQGVLNYYINYGKDYLTSYGVDVTDPESGAYYMSMIEEQGVDIVTEIAVVRSMAAEAGLTVDKTAVSDALSKEKTNFGGDEAWQEWLTEYEVTEADIKWILEYQMLADALYEHVNSDLTMTDDEVAAIYNAAPADYDTYKFAHILLNVANPTDEAEWDAALAETQSMIASLNDGTATFEELAAEHNPDSTKATGGDLGQYVTASASPYVEEFGAAAFKLTEIGEITQEPVKTDFGYHIIKLLDRTTGVEAAKDTIIDEQLGEERYNRYAEKVAEAMENVNITQDYERKYAAEEPADDADTAADTDTNTDTEGDKTDAQ
ncbi:MAG: peptidylprolyl isomerase [Firmicutes bacterium]|nr:peptidylprolyl isomerase [Bacillota bacterium]